MRVTRLFAWPRDGVLASTQRVRTQLYGSLGATGKGHGSDKAVLLGLAGFEPDTVEIDAIPARLHAIRAEHVLRQLDTHAIAFDEKTDLVFHRRGALPFHANGMLHAFDAAGGGDRAAPVLLGGRRLQVVSDSWPATAGCGRSRRTPRCCPCLPQRRQSCLR
jgi:hypothetical protein